MTEEEEEQENNVFSKEIESSSNFEYALREEEDRILFKKMLNECQKEEEYGKAFKAKGEYNSAESLFMALIFQQQKMISKLIDKLSEYKEILSSVIIDYCMLLYSFFLVPR